MDKRSVGIDFECHYSVLVSASILRREGRGPARGWTSVDQSLAPVY